MNNDLDNVKTVTSPEGEIDKGQSTPVKLTAMELNNIKLDPKHTLLTPDYLENLIKQIQDKES